MTVNAPTQAIDEAKLMAFMGKIIADFGALASSALVIIGDKLGLYRAMAGAGPLTPTELAQRTSTSERYVREWLFNQAAGGYVEYDPLTDRYNLPPEHALALAVEGSPANIVGGFQLFTGMIKAEPRITQAFRTGEGVPWGEHDPDLFIGTERFFRTGYAANLVSSWIPALEGVEATLKAGAKVADVGCGYGASTIIMARAYPRSRFYGFDFHAPSIARARQSASEAGVAERVTFDVATANDYPGTGYDVVAYFDAFHDLGDPEGAARHASDSLAPGGTVLLVEPMAGESVAENLNPVGRIFSAGSTFICTPNALATGGHALGNSASEKQLRAVMLAGGFSRFRRATQTPFNRIFEVKR
jgi:2-polyprenyl-3-methyl-5-hydroxy-6-metoxy-1,4-benzoquinol methylase